MVQQISISDYRVTEVSVNGIPMLTLGAFNWVQTKGITPYQTELYCLYEEAEQLYQTGKVEIKILPADHDNATYIKNVWVLETRIHPNIPGVSSILITDHRFFWQYPLYVGNFNDRRNAVSYFRARTDSNPLEISPVEPIDQYLEPTTIDGVNRYPPFEILKRVFDNTNPATAPGLIQVLKTGLGLDISFDVKFRHDPSFKDLPGVAIEDFDPKMTYADVINQLLQLIPGSQVSVSLLGNILIHDQTNGNEKLVVEALGTPLQGGMLTTKVQSKWRTPRKINVWFRRLIELKATGVEASSSTDDTVTLADAFGNPNDFYMENVIIVPDESIRVSELQPDRITRKSRIFTRGEYCNLVDYLEALEAAPGIGFKLNLAFLRQSELPYNDLYASLERAGIKEDQGPWKDRIDAISFAFRKLWRLNRKYVDRFEKIIPRRIAIINAAYGSQARSNVYSDHHYISGVRADFRNFNVGGLGARITAGSNVAGYTDRIGPTTRPAPAEIEVVNAHQGIIYIKWPISNSRIYQSVVPGLLENPPGFGLKGVNYGPITYDSIKAQEHGLPTLVDGYKVSTIFTVLPIAPSNRNQLHKVEVRPEHVVGLVTDAVYKNAYDAQGPNLDIFIDKLEYARIRYSEDYDYRPLLGLSEFNDTPEIPTIEEDLLANNLVLNQTPNANSGQNPDQVASLSRISQAAAAAAWASYVPHFVGGKTGKFNPAITPMGWTDHVTHTVYESGFVTTSANFPESIQILNLRNYVDPRTASLFDKLAIVDVTSER